MTDPREMTIANAVKILQDCARYITDDFNKALALKAISALQSIQPEASVLKNAERYVWLRDHCNYGVMGSDNPSFALNCDEPIAEWDAAIDRELAQATERK